MNAFSKKGTRLQYYLLTILFLALASMAKIRNPGAIQISSIRNRGWSTTAFIGNELCGNVRDPLVTLGSSRPTRAARRKESLRPTGTGSGVVRQPAAGGRSVRRLPVAGGIGLVSSRRRRLHPRAALAASSFAPSELGRARHCTTETIKAGHRNRASRFQFNMGSNRADS